MLYKVSLGGNQGISCQTSQRCLHTWNTLHLSQKDSFSVSHLRTTSSKKEISCPHPKGLHTQARGRDGATRHSGGSLHATPWTLMADTCASRVSTGQADSLTTRPLYRCPREELVDCLHSITRDAKCHMWGGVCMCVLFYVHTCLHSLQCANCSEGDSLLQETGVLVTFGWEWQEIQRKTHGHSYSP